MQVDQVSPSSANPILVRDEKYWYSLRYLLSIPFSALRKKYGSTALTFWWIEQRYHKPTILFFSVDQFEITLYSVPLKAPQMSAYTSTYPLLEVSKRDLATAAIRFKVGCIELGKYRKYRKYSKYLNHTTFEFHRGKSITLAAL